MYFHQSFKKCSILTPDIRKQPQTSLKSIYKQKLIRENFHFHYLTKLFCFNAGYAAVKCGFTSNVISLFIVTPVNFFDFFFLFMSIFFVSLIHSLFLSKFVFYTFCHSLFFPSSVILDIPSLRTGEEEKEVKATYCKSLGEMLPLVDFLVITCSLNDNSKHIIGKRELSQMKSSAIIVNGARG